ncbi:MAG TPA: hypothetical protein VEJ18_06765 [Planctomycetota bacterium]|nr:hypothetical protein [Planctomycetota bacterium]
MRELRLGLDGKALVFPDGRPICLACGAEPTGTRRVWFETMDAGADLSRPGSLERGVAALRHRVAFDATLCGRHLRRARGLSLKAAGLGLLSVALLVGAIVGFKAAGWDLSKEKSLLGYLPFVPALVPAVFAYFAWQAKDRGGLDCEARRDGEDLVLTYPAPAGRAS